MKVFIAGLDTETNTFAPIPNGRRAFADGFIAHGDATRQPENYCSAQLHVWRRLAEARGWPVAESLCAFAIQSANSWIWTGREGDYTPQLVTFDQWHVLFAEASKVAGQADSEQRDWSDLELPGENR